MKNVVAVILAAGKGTRMKSALPKVLHPVCGLPLLVHLIRQVKKAGIKRIVVVAGYGKDAVVERLQPEHVTIVEQREQRGTGHALLVCERALKGHTGDILVIAGDVFFDEPNVLNDFYAAHRAGQHAMSILTMQWANPFGYGRIIREGDEVCAIREELDASDAERQIDEINTGIYFFRAAGLMASLKRIGTNNKKKECYLTSAVDIYRAEGKKIGGYLMQRSHTLLGVNDRVQLAELDGMVKQRIIEQHQRAGVTVVDPASTYIETDVVIGQDTVIYPSTYIERGVRIGSGCVIGPFCKIRSGSVIDDTANVGSFVEIVRSRVGKKTNIKHLSYIGDAAVGRGVNIGAGTITANYDGVHKNKTTIGDGAFIGSNTVLIAPVTIGRNARTGAGSVVPKRHHVPSGRTALGVPARVLVKKKI